MKIVNLIFDVEIVKVDTFLLGRISKESWIFFFYFKFYKFLYSDAKNLSLTKFERNEILDFLRDRNF